MSVKALIKRHRLRCTFMAVLCCVITAYGQADPLVAVKRSIKAMGTSFEITIVAQNEEIGFINIEEAATEIRRVEKLISTWLPGSETSRINANAGIKPVKVSREVYNLIDRSKQISAFTEGMFDITYAPLNDIWKFDGTHVYMPTPEAIFDAVSLVGYEKLILDPGSNSVFLPRPGMKLGFEAIGKGYALERVRDLMVSRQVPGGLINASGDITSWGANVSGESWIIGIDRPGLRKGIFTWIPIDDLSVSIAENHKKYLNVNGKRYGHILNPVTGYPTSGVQKAVVFSRSAELNDALSTAIILLGVEKGLKLIENLDGIEAVIEDNAQNQHTTSGLELNGM